MHMMVEPKMQLLQPVEARPSTERGLPSPVEGLADVPCCALCRRRKPGGVRLHMHCGQGVSDPPVGYYNTSKVPRNRYS